jgi:hypothetical protein
MRTDRRRIDLPTLDLPAPCSAIDAELLERMARIARGLPGRTVSADGGIFEGRICIEEDLHSDLESAAVLRIDGVVVAEILEQHLAMTG